MVAAPCYTVAAGGVSMLAWAVWTLLLCGLVNARASGLDSGRFGDDVRNDEVMIDKLKELWNKEHHLPAADSTRPRHQPPLNPGPAAPSRPNQAGEKIQFAVTPKDPRYYHPATQRHADPSPPAAELFRYLAPDLTLTPRLDYPADLLQYQDDELQYPADYQGPLRPQYPQEEPRHPSYLTQQDLTYPLYTAGIQDPRLIEGDEEEEGGREVDAAREEFRKRLLDEGNYMDEDGQLMMKKGEVEAEKETKNEKEVNVEALTIPQPHKYATSQPETMNYMHLRRAPPANHEATYSVHQPPENNQHAQLSDLYFTALVAGCTAVAVCGVVGAGICWYRLNKSHKQAQDTDYPAYGVTGPNKDLSPSGDRKLAQYAHMYHYQHQKQQMIALEKSSGGERHGSASDVDSEEEGEENEYTVYECPGLAPTGEMEVKNPLFHDDPTPATPSIRKEAEQEHDHQEEERSTK